MAKRKKQTTPLILQLPGQPPQPADPRQVQSRIQQAAREGNWNWILRFAPAIHPIERVPGAEEAWFSALEASQRLQELDELTEKRLAQRPRDPSMLSWRAHALRLCGQPEKALPALEKAVRHGQPDAKLFNALGSVHKELGDFEAAKGWFARAIGISPGYAKAHWNRSDLLSTTEEMEKAADEARIALDLCSPPQDRPLLHFCLYRFLEKLEAPNQAFEQLAQANDLKKRQIPPDARADTELTDRIIQHFSTPTPATGAPDSRRPIFVVGLPRSGTTLVEQILASHSQVHGGNELSALKVAGSQVQRRARLPGAFPDWLASASPGDIAEIGRHYLQLTDPIAGESPHLTDKSLLNFRAAGLIHQALPGARILNVVRDPRDLAFSCYRQNFGSAFPFSSDFEAIASALEDHDRLSRHWAKVLPPSHYRQLSYEKLVSDPEREIAGILEHCGLAPEDACYHPERTSRAVRTLSATQVREPIHRSGVGAWKRYETQLAPLMEALERQDLL